MAHIGKNIKKLRKIKSLSQQAFADLFSLTRGNISSYEEFRAEPKIEVVIRIANYFGIPLSDFIEKDLSVNELLHYNANLVVETEKIKISQQLVKIPYVPVLYANDFSAQHNDKEFIKKLPSITIPSNSRFSLIAIEIESLESLPSNFKFRKGDILIFEHVDKENVHRIEGKLGMMLNLEGIRFGIYGTANGTISMYLNDWVNYPFDMESDSLYWALQTSIRQEH